MVRRRQDNFERVCGVVLTQANDRGWRGKTSIIFFCTRDISALCAIARSAPMACETSTTKTRTSIARDILWTFAQSSGLGWAECESSAEAIRERAAERGTRAPAKAWRALLMLTSFCREPYPPRHHTCRIHLMIILTPNSGIPRIWLLNFSLIRALRRRKLEAYHAHQTCLGGASPGGAVCYAARGGLCSWYQQQQQ